MKVKSLSHVQLFVIPWAIAYRAPPSIGRQEYWSGLPFPSPGIFLTQGSNLGLLHCRQMLYRLSHQGSQLRLTEGNAIGRTFFEVVNIGKSCDTRTPIEVSFKYSN